ncbi:hypothetical protein [Haloarchaeobius iranensis]|uniref:hypothetical protein n=1 Tax=Haloarchaeobius iranensis TaxID=996166 RepID=UPI0036406A9D
MSLQAVVKKDFLDVRRAKLVWGVGLLYTLFAVLSFWGIGSSSDTDIYNALFSMAGIGRPDHPAGRAGRGVPLRRRRARVREPEVPALVPEQPP